MKKRKQDFCPYKEYWFGNEEEAQEKPAGFKYKRGTLLKLRRKSYLPNARWERSLATFSPNGRTLRFPSGFDSNTIIMIFDYDSEPGKIKLWDDRKDKGVWVKTVLHTFTYLCGEKWESITLEVWGDNCKLHNEMWHKARKPRKPPMRKQKRRPASFSFDEEE